MTIEAIQTSCPFDAPLILGSDPFYGECGDGERILSDRVAQVRKSFSCHGCAEQRQPGEWARIRREAGSDGIATYRWCTPCCQAEERINDDGGDALTARECIGDAIRRGAPEAEIEKLRERAAEAMAASFETD